MTVSRHRDKTTNDFRYSGSKFLFPTTWEARNLSILDDEIVLLCVHVKVYPSFAF